MEIFCNRRQYDMKKWLIMIAGVIMLICISVPVLASDTLETANTVIGVSVYNLNDARCV